jgi:hypothetical protein
VRIFSALLAAALLAGCGSPCEDLADRICGCRPAGSERENCRRAVEQQIEEGDPRPGDAEQDLCERKLDTCHAPAGTELCDWIATEGGKVACGLAHE